ncbi:sensor domain-containing diguanylate cyclase [Massilia sp. METH4]|uniref:GGDEF domain-containing protein n=1 Tax=Massilia sp. METH4 TaxID=3123041 RepID=UPI0030D3BE7D
MASLNPESPPASSSTTAGSLESLVGRLSTRKRPVIRLLLLSTAFACTVVIAVAIWFIYSSRQTQIRETEVATTNVARMVGIQVELAMKAAGLVLADITERAENDRTDAKSLARLNGHLAALARATPELHGLFVYGADGAWLASSLSEPVGGNNADREYFRYHRAHAGREVHVGAPMRSRSTGVWIIPVSRRIQHADGSFAGVALVTLRINFFERVYDELNIGRTGIVLLMQSNGTVVYRRPFDEKLIGQDLSKGNIFAELRKANAGSAFLVAKVDGIERLYSYRRLDTAPFLVAVGQTRQELLSNWARTSIVIGSAAFLICVIFGWFATRLIRQIVIRDQLDQKLRIFSERLQEHNIDLHALAHTDKLTQLPNRRRFDEQLLLELKRADRANLPISLILMDLDYFKQFNDHYGHQAGDRCLQSVAKVLSDQVTRAGDLAARIGGEEFAVILPNTDRDGALAVAERIRVALQALAIPHQMAASRVVTSSLGVATAVRQQPGKPSVDELIAVADAQLYRAKHGGRNQVSGGVLVST